MSALYSVNFWGSHPDDENDDCYEAEGFATLEEAHAVFAAEVSDRDVAYVELDGPDVYDIRKNPIHRPRRRDSSDLEWRNEFAMQQGMGLGIDAYNDAMGYDTELHWEDD